MKASRQPASRLPRSTSRSSTPSRRNSSNISGRDKSLPSRPVAAIVPITPGSINTTLNDESRPHSPSAASFSRIRNNSGLPIRSGAASPMSRFQPSRRTPSLLSNAPSTPESYNYTDEELSGLRSVNRLSREGRERRPRPGYYQARLVDIPPSRKKVNSEHFSSSLPSTSIHTNTLPTIHSQAQLPAFDFDQMQPRFPSPSANSVMSATPPSTPHLDLPPRSDSRAPLIELVHGTASLGIDDGSQYEEQHEFDNFSGTVEAPNFDNDATNTDDGSEVGDGYPVGRGLVRHDSPMEPVTRSIAADATSRTCYASQEATQMLSDPVEVAASASQREQELAGRIETLPYTNTAYFSRFAPPQPTFQPPRSVGYGGLAGVNTPGKMRAAAAARETLQQKSEPNFARRTASSTAKSSVPPDIPRMAVSEAPMKAQLPSKGRSVFGKLGSLFHKGQKERTEKSPIRMRIGRDTASTNNRLKAKRQSTFTAFEIRRSPTPTPSSPHKTPEWKPSPLEMSSSQVTLTAASKIPPPAFFGRRSVSPASDDTITPATARESPIPADGSEEANTALYEKLVAQYSSEHDERRKNKLYALAQSLAYGLKFCRFSEHWAKQALIASDHAQKCMDNNKKMLVMMQKKAVLSMKKE